MKFIELHEKHNTCLVNVDAISKVRSNGDGTAFVTFWGHEFAITTDESYERVKALIYGDIAPRGVTVKKHGARWIGNGYGDYKCSSCGFVERGGYRDECPNCGSKVAWGVEE